MQNDPYKVLGVSSTASQDDIKKSYRKLAKKWHPDMHIKDKDKEEAEHEFKKISEAYQVVGDPEKRKQHDNIASFGFSFGEDHFNTVFRREPVRGRNIRAAVNITLEESATGGNQKISFPRNIICEPCKGTGAKNSDMQHCSKCNGAGFVTFQTTQSGVVFQRSSTCIKCQGHGQYPLDKCDKCLGFGVVSVNETLNISIPLGINHNEVILIKEKGLPGPGGPGDLVLVIRIIPHDKFMRDGNNLISNAEVPFLIALRGGSIEYETLLGEKIFIDVPRACAYGHEVVFSGKGINNGFLTIHLSYSLPSLDENKLNKIHEIMS